MTSRSQSLRDAIEEQIAIGELRPGQHLDETELATRPVRPCGLVKLLRQSKRLGP